MGARDVSGGSGDLAGRSTDREVGGRAIGDADGVAHVHHAWLSERGLYLAVAALAGWKAFEIATWAGVTPRSLLAATPMAVGVFLSLLRPHLGMALISVTAFTIVVTPPDVFGQPSVNHITLMAWITASLALFSGEQQRFVLRAQLAIMYGFSATAKLWREFLDGSALEAQTWVGAISPTWLLVGAAIATFVIEATLAVLVWAKGQWWKVGFWLAVLTHLAFATLTVSEPWRIGRLVLFGALSLLVWARVGPASPLPATRWPGGLRCRKDGPDLGATPTSRRRR